ncbi:MULTISPECIES: type VI secretion system baseplate subunit TssF [unclassified Variovorax]|uniref:type VI secretion system baseplate subunit TssF n=1 Tax=unclassified Variovorax TaxID=663243 RepID=UPI000C1A81BF|nr:MULTISPECIES: type VI secretion system baseplate subunit TssF [Variovorax]PIF75575.1 type VI secretion system protein ImpG [Variovorax sp. 54]WPG37506.1 type VI secretion system baseplate subunit TssF [Variovorax boronicumulans]
MDELLPFYERELAFLRGYSQEFAKGYPKIAARLAISADASEDPHVERMIQSFALLTARISKKLDDDYPELTEALLEVMYPHYLRPFPSCSIAQFDAGGAALAKLSKPITIARGTELTSQPVRGGACRFRSVYDVTLAAVQVSNVVYHSVVNAPAQASLPRNATGCLSVTLEATGEQKSLGTLALTLARLRTFIDAEPSLATALADAIFLKTAAVFVEPERSGKWTLVQGEALHPVGFDEADALIELPARSHPAYRLLSEYFAFPEKFNFVDIDLANALRHIGSCRSITLHLVMTDVRADSPTARLLEGVSSRNLRLGCTPVINLFKQRSDPIRVTHAAAAYPVVADARRAFGFEVYSIDSVKLVKQTAEGDAYIEFRPFYSLHHGEHPKEAEHYWFARRNELVAQRSPGYETELSIVDIDFQPSLPQTETLSIDLTCTNRDLPHSLAFGLPGGDLFIEGNSVARSIRMLRRPTQTLRMPRGKGVQWRLVSHLSLNHLSLATSGLPALKEMLRLYDLGRSAVSARQIEAITAIEQQATTQWLPGKPFATFVRGIELRLTVDETGFVGSSLQAFARVMDHFFGLYVHLNSFTQLVIVSARDKEELVRCKPRSGESILL